MIVPEITETTALGAAYLAGIATGIWDQAEVGEMWREAARYEPRMARRRARPSWSAAGREAVERSRCWSRGDAPEPE